MIFEAHEIHPADELDWIKDPDVDEYEEREKRNFMLRDMLQSGESVQFRSSGNSLRPKVQSGDVTMWEPVTEEGCADLKVGDIVFCRPQPKNYFYGHAIHEINQWSDGRTYWVISNLKKGSEFKINGWCLAEHIYGKLMEVSGVEARGQY